MSSRRRSVLARLGSLGALLLSGVLACSTVRSDLCATVHTRVLEEQRITEEAPRHVLDPHACARHARRLRELSEELRGLEIRDASLRMAMDSYRTQLESLSEHYAQLASAYRSRPDKRPEEDAQARDRLSRRLVDHAASMNGPRTLLKGHCDSF
ncbi:hypothetical protein [Hyalangium rubrum]|uniref:Lipoprotein n=1 Tax=Hyalangium rubrum TaxID=3103134 RepID=A0ABU5GZB1_9BACT|nr:hypothetical protein [Hyalangium sp. s54d21]MDY7226396.1 hypothetical protein [Hyalangium sp. s54d21]